MRRRSSILLVAALVGTVGMAGGVTACSDDGDEPRLVEPDEVYVAIIRWQLARLESEVGGPTGTASSDVSPTASSAAGAADLPVVYVAAADGADISAQVQARVAAATVDEATIRFADSPDDAIDSDAEDEPVIDDGVLLSVERLEPDPSRRRTTEVTVYRSLTDQQTWLLTVDASSDDAAVTSSTWQSS